MSSFHSWQVLNESDMSIITGVAINTAAGLMVCHDILSSAGRFVKTAARNRYLGLMK